MSPSSRAPGRAPLAAALVLMLLALPTSRAAAQLVEPGEPILELRTVRFDIYYPAALAAEAGRLASFADAAYASLAARFPDGAGSPRRIPVLLAEGYASPNGSFNPYPSDRIVLLVAPVSLFSDLGSFDDDLRGIFTHELAHALSTRTRSPFWSFWASALGDPVTPSLWTATRSLSEGASVASEGKGGSGRARDPLALSLVKQDILEGKFKGFWEATGAWDAYPFGRLPYIYGGLFTARLIETRGEEAYAELWRRIGQGNAFSGVEGGLFRKGAFEAAYGLGLEEAWEEFREAMAIREPVVMATRRLAREPGYISALTAGASGLYWADASAGAILALEPGAAGPRFIRSADGLLRRLDLSPDGSRLLVSWSSAPDGLSKGEPFALAIDSRSGKPLGKALPGLGEAAFAGEAVVGIHSAGYRSDLVIDRGGERSTLLSGGPDRSYSSPASLDGEIVYCLAKDSGRVLVVRVDVHSGRAWALVPSLPLERIRSLDLAPGEGGGARLALSYAAEGCLYRLALVEDPPPGGGEPRMRRQEALLSGSVLLPAQGGEEIYYLGRFSEGEYPCAYPKDNPALALREAPAAWAELDPSFLRPSGAQAPEALAGAPAPALPLLFQTFRLPSLPLDGDSAGIAILGSDIAERLAWSIEARYDWVVQGADLALYLGFGLDPWSLSVSLSDGFSAASGDEIRASEASLGLSRTWHFLPARRTLELGLEASAAALAPASKGEAYAAPYGAAGAVAAATLRFSSYRSSYFSPFDSVGAGTELSLDAEWSLAPQARSRPALALEAGADAALPFLGFAASLRAAASPDASLAFGPGERGLADGKPSVRSPRYGSYQEYAILPAKGSLFILGDASITPFAFELQRRLALGKLSGPLYFNRLYVSGGFRAALYGAELSGSAGAELLSSAYGRLVLVGSPLVGMASSSHFALGTELSWAFRGDLAKDRFRIAFLAGALL